MQPQLKYTFDDQAHHIYMKGDKTNQIEPPEVYLHFPGGQIGVCRVNDNTYWAHFSLEGIKDPDAGNYEPTGKVIDWRIDCKELSASEMKPEHITRPDLNHLAIKVQKI